MKLNSSIWLDGSELKNLTACSRSGILGGLGYARSDISRKPIIGIVNSYTEINPGHAHLDKVAEAVKQGVLMAGGVPFEFNTPAPCDATSCGLEPMKYILPQRDLIADSIEMMVRCNSFDGLVFISSCDKIVPGQLMAAARLNLPAIFVPGGPALPHLFFAPKDKAASEPNMNYMRTGAECLQEDIFRYECPGLGACSGFGTANTMQSMAEVLGMAYPMCATTHAVDAGKLRFARDAGRRVIELVADDIRPAKIMTKHAFENAIAVHTAMGGSTNAVLHLLAIAHEMGVDLGIDDFERIGRGIPCVCGVKPSGKYEQLDLHRAGGLPAIEKRIDRFMHGDALNVSGVTVEQIIKDAVIADEEVIRPLNDPFYEGGGLAIMHGNLAPNTGVIKASAVRPEMRVHTGPAKVFNSEVEARLGIDQGKVQDGDVIVIRYEGPRGGPGMREMLLITRYLVYTGKGDNVALVTDGRFSGFTSGPAVGHVCPEAADGGPIALVEDGDIITIDIPARKLTLHVSDEELAERKKHWKPLKRDTDGYIKRYARDVQPACEGAWLD